MLTSNVDSRLSWFPDDVPVVDEGRRVVDVTVETDIVVEAASENNTVTNSLQKFRSKLYLTFFAVWARPSFIAKDLTLIVANLTRIGFAKNITRRTEEIPSMK